MNPAPPQLKATQRSVARARLARMSVADRARASAAISLHLRASTPWRTASSVLFFAALSDEPDLGASIVELLATQRRAALPRSTPDGSGYVACEIQNLDADLVVARFGISEPKPDCRMIPIPAFDLILVPGVAFDRRGWRLGRGQGFYDRLLADANPAALCGVAFAEQILPEISHEPHDRRMRWLVTPEGWTAIGE